MPALDDERKILLMGWHWDETAALIASVDNPEPGEFPCHIIKEGPLFEVLIAVAELSAEGRRRVSVNLPDRRVPPFSFRGATLTALIDDPERPLTLRSLHSKR